MFTAVLAQAKTLIYVESSLCKFSEKIFFVANRWILKYCNKKVWLSLLLSGKITTCQIYLSLLFCWSFSPIFLFRFLQICCMWQWRDLCQPPYRLLLPMYQRLYWSALSDYSACWTPRFSQARWAEMSFTYQLGNDNIAYTDIHSS